MSGVGCVEREVLSQSHKAFRSSCKTTRQGVRWEEGRKINQEELKAGERWAGGDLRCWIQSHLPNVEESVLVFFSFGRKIHCHAQSPHQTIKRLTMCVISKKNNSFGKKKQMGQWGGSQLSVFFLLQSVCINLLLILNSAVHFIFDYHWLRNHIKSVQRRMRLWVKRICSVRRSSISNHCFGSWSKYWTLKKVHM